MADYIEIFNEYIMGSIEVLFQFYFFAKILNRKVVHPFYFLFSVCAAAVICVVPVSTIAGFGALILLLMTSAILIFRKDFKLSLLYAALVVEIMQLSYGMMKSLFSILYPLMSAVFYDRAGIVLMVSSQITSLILAFVCYYIIYRYFSHYTAAEMQYIFLVFIPILMIFIMDEYINSIIYGWEVIESRGNKEYLVHWQMLVIQLLGIASLFCILFTYKKLLHSFRLSTELTLLEQEEHSLNQYVDEAKSHYEKTKSFRHDIRNHISVVKKLLQGGKTEEAIHYIRDMEDIAEELSFPCSTNHPVVDVLVGNKLSIAESMGIDVHCSLLLPYPCGLRDIDICIILSNALDNAIHACKSMEAGTEKYIHVSGRIQGDYLMMKIENSYRAKKKKKKGTGLSNIKAVTEKYDGAMSIDMQGNVFVLHVLLIIPPYTEN